MTGTKRIYNKPNKIGVYHPYVQLCMGNCKRHKPNKRKRSLKKNQLRTFLIGGF